VRWPQKHRTTEKICWVNSSRAAELDRHAELKPKEQRIPYRCSIGVVMLSVFLWQAQGSFPSRDEEGVRVILK
jgi:hypothetical protein